MRSQSDAVPRFSPQPKQPRDDEDNDYQTAKRRKSSSTATPNSESQHKDPKNDVSSNEQLENFLSRFSTGKKNKADLKNALRGIFSTEESVLSLMHILTHISNPNSTLASKEFWARVPPSDAVYRIIAAQVGLPLNNPPTWDSFPGWDILNLDKILGRAPLVLHKRVVEAFSEAQKGLPDIVEHDNEAVKVASLMAPLQIMVGYFHGRIINFPERSIPATQISKAGRIEDQWYTAQLVIFVREVKKLLSAADLGKHIAQAMCELIATSHLNETKGFRGLPVYCILTDAKRSQILCYTPDSTVGEFGRFARFLVPSDLTISGETLSEKIDSLSSGLWINIYFSIFLEGYRASTQAFYDLSVARAAAGDISSQGSHRAQPALIPQTPVPPLLTGSNRLSTEGWCRAVKLADSAQLYLVDAKRLGSEKQAEHAMSYLQESVRAWPHDEHIFDDEDYVERYVKGYLNKNKDTGESRDVVEIQNSKHLKKVEDFKLDFFKTARTGRSGAYAAMISVVETKIENKAAMASFLDIFGCNEATCKEYWLHFIDLKESGHHVIVMSELVRLSGDEHWCKQAKYLRKDFCM